MNGGTIAAAAFAAVVPYVKDARVGSAPVQGSNRFIS